MSDTERLVQRFLDQELSADERIQFVVELGRSDALRRQVVALETLTSEAARLPRPAVPSDFVTSVMNRLEPSNLRTLPAPTLAPSTPRTFAPVWSLAAAAACVLFGALGWFAGRNVNAPATATVPSTVLVRLVVVQPGAQSVQVAGDFNGWNPGRTPLEPAESGAWTVTLPLEPGRYEYMFVVDGQTWIADPFATEQDDDGFGAQNAVLDVRPAGTGSL
jgi:hypothetical protein